MKVFLIGALVWIGAFIGSLVFFAGSEAAGLLNLGNPVQAAFLLSLAITGFYLYKNWPQPVVVEPVVVPEPKPAEPAPYKYPPMPDIKKSPYYQHGSANWENPKHVVYPKFNDLSRTATDEDHLFDGVGYYIGAGLKVKTLMHSICLAGTGQGKGACIVLPNLLAAPEGSWFVLDPKGENASITARYQKESGQNVIILDPWDEQKRLGATHGIERSGFNPLVFVRENPDEMSESCGVIAQQIVLSTAKDSKSEYWEERAKSLIKTYLLHLMTARPKEEQHLGTLYRWLRIPIIERSKLWLEMHENLACDELVRSGIGEFIGMNPNEGPLPSIISTAQSNTSFLESTALRDSLSKDDFNPYDLTDGKTTLYLCLPERFLLSHNRWLRIVVGVCLKACNHRANKRVTFLLDEFALLGKMTDVQNAYAFSRGQNVQLAIFAQTLAQLVEIYGEHGMNTFLSNARIRQFFGIYDLQTQKYLSEYLGDQTVKDITKNESFSKSTNSTYSSGSSSSYNSGGNTTSSGHSDTTSSSSTTAYNESLHSRRLLTSEEIGKTPAIITFIDGHKCLIPRVPYWGGYYDGFIPSDVFEWEKYIDVIEGRKPWPKAVFPKRADTSNVKVDTHQRGLPTSN